MEDDQDNNQREGDYSRYTIIALKAIQQDNTTLRAELQTLRTDNSKLLADSSKKKRGGTSDNRLGYKDHVVSWSKCFLFTRSLFVDISIFSAKPFDMALDPAAIFATDDLYIQSLTIALYEDIPPKFHSLLNSAEYSGLAKDFIREHGDARSSFINAVRKALPSI
ncbi:hypothetical protein B0H10DRAFT_2219766 [Mycena sp. CBHHK59/15]|nr:hypothetical protein B0H10DRAFT_2219766 [Mycena sp. CBHHK59/15]